MAQSGEIIGVRSLDSDWGQPSRGNIFVKPIVGERASNKAVTDMCGNCGLKDKCKVKIKPAESNVFYGRRMANIVPISGIMFLEPGCAYNVFSREATNNVNF